MRFITGFYLNDSEGNRIEFNNVKLDAASSAQITQAVELLGGQAYYFDCRGERSTQEDRDRAEMKEQIIDIVNEEYSNEEYVKFLNKEIKTY